MKAFKKTAKFIFLLIPLLSIEVVSAQVHKTKFVVKDPSSKFVQGIEVIRNNSSEGKTDLAGVVWLTNLNKGELLLFKDASNEDRYPVLKYKVLEDKPNVAIEILLEYYEIQEEISYDAVPVQPEERQDENEIHTSVDVAAEFPGGQASMFKWIGSNMRYPQSAIEDKIGGKCYLKFVVEKDGSITDIQVVRSSGCRECDAEALRVIKSMPKWIPSKIQGKAVRSYFNLPIVFQIEK